MQVSIQECPPGFVYNPSKRRCVCLQNSNLIHSCSEEDFHAVISPGYWIGYCDDGGNSTFGKAANLLHALCPRERCQGDGKDMSLPQTTNMSQLDEVICGKYRTGILCSRCRKGYAAHYHHSTFACKSNNCKWGWLLYIVSEIVPVTALFIAIIGLKIKFTNGEVNGLIFFLQFSDTMLLQGITISFPEYSGYALQVYLFVARVFNLKFFTVNSLSFCLWENATSLDLLAFKYLTILFSSTLVVIIIAALNCNCSKHMMKLRNGSVNSTKNTIIHGISGFLVICYSECTQVSQYLLTSTKVYSSSNNCAQYTVSSYYGAYHYFHGVHLFYGLLALVIVFCLGILPPLLLISYPLCYKVLAVLKLNESKFSRLLCTAIPLEKVRPFFDSFQSSFKDEYRFFSGIYFLYRLTTLFTLSITSDLISFYSLIQIQNLLLLAVHAICQPYKKRSHNIIDSVLFMNLSAINMITLYNYFLSLNTAQDLQNILNITTMIQVTLLFLPLICFICYYVKNVIVFIKKRFHYRSFNRESCTCNDYQEFSRAFSLSTAERRLRDNEEL